MSHAEKIVNLDDRRPIVEADIDKGFDRLAGDLTNALATNEPRMSAREYQIVMAMVTKTYRYHKSSDWISHSQFSEITGIAKSNISKLLNSLEKKKIIIKEGNKVRINKVVSEWEKVKFDSSDKSNSTTPEAKSNSTKPKSNSTKPKSDSTTDLVKSDYHNRKTTDTEDHITEDHSRVAAPKSPANKTKSDVKSEIIALPIPSGLSFSMWKEWVESRFENKKPMTIRSANMQIKQLEAWQSKGHNLDEIIQTSIANNYQGLFEPKGFTQSRANTWQNRKTQNNIDVLSDFVNGGNHD